MAATPDGILDTAARLRASGSFAAAAAVLEGGSDAGCLHARAELAWMMGEGKEGA